MLVLGLSQEIIEFLELFVNIKLTIRLSSTYNQVPVSNFLTRGHIFQFSSYWDSRFQLPLERLCNFRDRKSIDEDAQFH